MKYIKAYLDALYTILSGLGLLYLILVFTANSNLMSSYLVYLGFIAALSGPVKILISK